MMKRFHAVAALALALAGCNAGPKPGDGPGGNADAHRAAEPSEVVPSPPPAGAAAGTPDPGGFKPFVEPRGRITQGRCHMDACSWTKWETLEVVKAGADEVELRASVVGGQSDHAKPDRSMPDYPDSADGVDIRWDPAPTLVEYRCSKARPTMKWGDEAPAPLALNPDSFIPGAMESAVRSYFVACHSDFAAGPGDEAVVKYGYRVPVEE